MSDLRLASALGEDRNGNDLLDEDEDSSLGGTCTGVVLVCVPHDIKRVADCVDGGAVYDSTVP